MKTITISQESLDRFKSGKKLMPAVFDNKDLLEDYLEDDIFGDFSWAKDHNKRGKRHLIGQVSVHNEKYDIESTIEVKWNWGENTIYIQQIACSRYENFDDQNEQLFDYYTELFQPKNNPVNGVDDLVVKTHTDSDGKIMVSFYWEVED